MASETKSALTGKPIVLLGTGWNGLIVDGQSLSTGQFSDPVLSTKQPYCNLTFGSGPRSSKPGSVGHNSSPGTTTSIPLVENYLAADDANMVGETRCSGAANYAAEQVEKQNHVSPANFVIFASCAGHGGWPIRLLAPGGPGNWYQLLLDQIAGAHTLAASAGFKYALHAVAWDEGLADVSRSYTPKIVSGSPSSPIITVDSSHGLLAGMIAYGYEVTTTNREAFLPAIGVQVLSVDSNAKQVKLAANPTATATGGTINFGLNRAQYGAALAALAADISASAMSITGQANPTHILVFQDNLSVGNGFLNVDAPVLGQWDQTRSNPLIHMVSPDYDCTRSTFDNVHLSNFAQLKQGNRLGRAYKQLVLDGKVPDAIDITGAVATGATLIATFRVPTPPLVLDTANLPAVAHYGFVVRDSGGTLTINSVAVGSNNTSLVFALHRTPKHDGTAMLRYALDHSGSAAPPAALGPNTAQWTVSNVISGTGGVDRVYLNGTTPALMFTGTKWGSGANQSVTVAGVNGVNSSINGAHTLSAVDSSAGQWIELAGTAFSGRYTSGGTVTVPVMLDGNAAGNLRDSTTDTFVHDGTTYPLWHICPHFEMPITTTDAIA